MEEVNKLAIWQAKELRSKYEKELMVVVDGMVGPRGDGYDPKEFMTPEEAEKYHSKQVIPISRGGLHHSL